LLPFEVRSHEVEKVQKIDALRDSGRGGERRSGAKLVKELGGGGEERGRIGGRK
jgi:hypothetical protein